MPNKQENKRVALFGGSFNPLHNGHIALAKAVLAHHYADEVWLLVSPQNPLKQIADLAPEQVRFDIVQKAISEETNIKASNIEFSLPRPSFTWNTLQALKEKYPNILFSLLIGADNWSVFSKWKNHELIVQNHQLLIYPRDNDNIDKSKLPYNAKIVNAPLLPISSTLIRERLIKGESIAAFVPQSVEVHISDYYHYFLTNAQ